jgi:hypothetical protein
MPRYSEVPDSPQVPTTRHIAPAAAAAKPTAPVDPLVPITTDIPASVRRDLKLACAIHEVRLKDAVEAALRAWLAEHPVRLEN